MAHDDQFTALGPSNTGAGFPRAGFSTKSSDTTYGVNVQGTQCGVYGESLAHSPGDRKAKDGTGVYGTGDQYGVYGISGNIRVADAPGFVGGAQDAIGVVGASLKSPGVIGVSDGIIASSLINPNVHDPTKEPIGVVGISRTKTGVFGLSVIGNGAGVVGQSGDAGTGIEGRGNRGAGIHGISKLDRGGVFESGDPRSRRLVPQVRLVPQPMTIPSTVPAKPLELNPKELNVLPKAGQGGDLLTTTDTKGTCILWFCVQGSTDSEPAHWSQVLLGTPIMGRM